MTTDAGRQVWTLKGSDCAPTVPRTTGNYSVFNKHGAPANLLS
jgi:hypothetical protein